MLYWSLHIQNNDYQVLKESYFNLTPFLSQTFDFPLFNLSEFCCKHSFSASEPFSHQFFCYYSQSPQLVYYTLDAGITVIFIFQNFYYLIQILLLYLFFTLFCHYLKNFYFSDSLVDWSSVECLVYKKRQVPSVTLSSRMLFSLLNRILQNSRKSHSPELTAMILVHCEQYLFWGLFINTGQLPSHPQVSCISVQIRFARENNSTMKTYVHRLVLTNISKISLRMNLNRSFT